MELSRIDGSLNEVAHQRFHDFVTAQFHVEHHLGVVYFLERHLCASAVGIALQGADVVNQTSLEGAGKYLLLVVAEHFDALVLQFANHAGTHIDHAFVLVEHAFVDHAPPYLLLGLFVEELQQQPFGLSVAQQLQLVGIFDVHYLVADVVGSLDEVDQRMAEVRRSPQPQLCGNALVGGALALEVSELAFLPCLCRWNGVFHDAGQRAVGHYEAPVATASVAVGEQAEGIGVALEVRDVVPEHGAHSLAQVVAGAFGEV